ncbi:MAG: putative DsbA family dithiol-disulfide isomerase [Bacteroidia bacterium]|jgi:predicted DsbA family dithiol-disulfide isomerase|tara:strand:+ start:180 stop:830 length:651 start_codon:yes stop_codon:yes gene_type:complete
MSSKIKIDVVSDVVCPWCIVGYKRLEKAIAELDIADKIELEWQPFELNPAMPTEGENINEHLTKKYGSSAEDNARNRANLTSLGAAEGFTFDFYDAMRMVNTRGAHVLLDYAKESGKQTALNIRLITAFYSERKDVSDRAILSEELKTVGLNVEEGLARLDATNSKADIHTKETYWQEMGVSGVPTVVFNRTSALTGAQPLETYKQVLTELVAELD